MKTLLYVLGWMIPAASAYSIFFYDDVFLSDGTIAYGNNLYYSANLEVHSNGEFEIQSGARAHFWAGYKVVLRPGFHAANGSFFRAATDLDLDGISDLDEGTDTDGDGIGDTLERSIGLDPNNAADSYVGDINADGIYDRLVDVINTEQSVATYDFVGVEGVSYFGYKDELVVEAIPDYEYIWNVTPYYFWDWWALVSTGDRLPMGYFFYVPPTYELLEVRVNGFSINAIWASESGKTYQAQTRADSTEPWSNLGSPVPGTGSNISYMSAVEWFSFEDIGNQFRVVELGQASQLVGSSVVANVFGNPTDEVYQEVTIEISGEDDEGLTAEAQHGSQGSRDDLVIVAVRNGVLPTDTQAQITILGVKLGVSANGTISFHYPIGFLGDPDGIQFYLVYTKIENIFSIDFIDQSNLSILSRSHPSLMVSKFTTSANLSPLASFDGPPVSSTGEGYGEGQPDPDTFRVQVIGIPLGSSPKAQITIDGATPKVLTFDMLYGTLNDHPCYRSDKHIRLVSNTIDASHSDDQTPIVALGDNITVAVLIDGEELCSEGLSVGLPSTSQGEHAVRHVAVDYHVLNHQDVPLLADTATATTRLNRAWAQAAISFSSSSSLIPYSDNIITVTGIALEPGFFVGKIDNTNVDGVAIGSQGREEALYVAEDIASGINAVLGSGVAEVFKTRPNAVPPIVHVVVNRGGDADIVIATQLDAQGISILRPSFESGDSLVPYLDAQPCLVANNGSQNRDEQIEFYVVKKVGARPDESELLGAAWPPSYCGADSDMVNASFVDVMAVDNSDQYPYTISHEAARLILDADYFVNGAFNLLDDVVDKTDTISGGKRLTQQQEQASRTINDGKLLKQ